MEPDFVISPQINPQIVSFDKLPSLASSLFSPEKATDLHKTSLPLLIMQYFSEHGFTKALKAFEEESYVKYDPDLLKMGGQLETILQEYSDLQELSKTEKISLGSVSEKKAQEELLTEGNGTFIDHLQKTVTGIHSANIISVAWSYHTSPLIATGAADKTVKILDFPSTQLIGNFTHHQGAAISLSFNPRADLVDLLLTSSMDKSFALINVKSQKVINHWKDVHSKFVVVVRWNPDGLMFATASQDHTVCIYIAKEPNVSTESLDSLNFLMAKQLTFNANPESLVFHPKNPLLIIAIRESNNLRLVDLAQQSNSTHSFPIEKFNLNANLDDHVSFSAMHVSFSPNAQYLLVSSDNNRLLLYQLGNSTPLRVFYGATNDIYSNPRNAWHPSGKYVYSTSQDQKIFCWSVSDQKIVAKLEGHSSTVRDLAHHPFLNILISVSYDKSIRIWDSSKEK